MKPWLLNKLVSAGMIDDNNQFAIFGTVNWMRALALVCEAQRGTTTLKDCYSGVQHRKPSDVDDAAAYSNLLMALHHAASVNFLSTCKDREYTVVRSAIVTWYYAVYWGAKAMLSANSPIDPQTHSKADRLWHEVITKKGLAATPFDINVDTLVRKDYEKTIDSERGVPKFHVKNTPESIDDARGVLYSYLSGTAKWRREKLEDEIKNNKEFKALNKQDFRSHEAQAFRDEILRKKHAGFLSQAIRYRGKANYRDSIYLSYGNDYTKQIVQLVQDLSIVARSFMCMTCEFVKRRTTEGAWECFCTDFQENFRAPVKLVSGCGLQI